MKEDFYSFAITPDGKNIVFLTTVGMKNWELFLFEPDSGKKTQLTDNIFREKRPSISPDGKWAIYVSDVEGNPEIFKIRLIQ